MSVRHLKSGDPLPARKDGVLRLYSMLYCPYAQCPRMVLAHKNIEFETVNVNLANKPTWLFERNPNGKVPILEIGDKVIYESDVCMEYLDENNPGDRLTPIDSYTRARGKILCKEYSKLVSAFYKLARGARTGDHGAKLDNFHKVLAAFEKIMPETKFLTGNTLSLADYNCWPWTERFPVLQELWGVELLKPDLYPKFCSWFAAMEETPGVKATRTNMADLKTFVLSYGSGKPEYDFASKL